MKKKLLFIFLTLVLLLTGCETTTDSEPETTTYTSDTSTAEKHTANTEDLTVVNDYAQYTDFTEFTDAMFRESIVTSSISLHYTLAYPENYDLTDYPISISTESYVNPGESVQRSYDYLMKLQSFDYDSLSTKEQFLYDILSYDLELSLDNSDLYLYTEPISPTVGDNAQIPILLAEYTFYDEDDVKEYLELLETLPDYFDEILALEQAKSQAGLFMSDTTADAIIDQCQQFISNEDDNYLITSFDERLDGVTDLTNEETETYEAQNEAAVSQYVLPAYEALIDGLTALKGTGVNQDGGLANLPLGKDYYTYLVAQNTGTNISVEDLEAEITDQVTADLQSIIKISAKDSSLLENMTDFTLPLTEPKACLTDLQSQILKDFPEGPEVSYEVKYVSESMKEHLSPAFYLSPPIDTPTKNVIYINDGKSSQTDQTLYATLAHEGYPGHLYQTTYFQNTNPALIRQLLVYPGYTEGWATYVECMSYDYADIDSNMAEVLSLNTTYSLGIYCLIDIGVNYDGWKLEDTITFLKRYGITDEAVAEEIFDTMVAEPANYLSYYVGCLEFNKLKEEAQTKEGDSFDIVAFHKQLLELGPAPFFIIEKYLFS
jgi:uncharacterized protein (DUF885 family)